MSFFSVLKKIGAVIAWPVTHAKMLIEFLSDAEKDYPNTKTVLVGLVDKFESLGPEVIGAIAAGGLNVALDGEAGAGLIALFAYFEQSVLPVIEQDYADFKAAEDAPETTAKLPFPLAEAPAALTQAASTVIDPASPVPQAGPGKTPEVIQVPGLHNVVRA